MIKISDQDKKTIDKYKRRVHKQYPGAFHNHIGNDYYTILQENDDLSIVDVLAEQFIPPQKGLLLAWETAQLSCRVSQNLNRTNPLRAEGASMADKISRAENRRLRAEIPKISRKDQEIDIY